MRSDRGKRTWRGLLLAALAALTVLSPTANTSAAELPTLWTRCDQDLFPCNRSGGVAVAPAGAPEPGAVQVVDQRNAAVITFTAWGELVRLFGREVNLTKVEAGAPAAEQDVCPVDPDDVCQAGARGPNAGQFEGVSGAVGIAVDSTGGIYVADRLAHRVQKFSPTGAFELMVGGDVNKTAVEEARPVAERNLCPAPGHPADVCGAGTTGTGPGQFESQPTGSYVAVGKADRLYVGDKNRIQIFSSAGAYEGDLPDPGLLLDGKTVQALASDKDGNLVVDLDEQAGVWRLRTSGVEICNTGSAGVEEPQALASDATNGFYVVDGRNKLFYPTRVRHFGPDCSEGEEALGPEKLQTSIGIAAGNACFNSPAKEAALYLADYLNVVGGEHRIRALGAAPSNLALCPRPPKAPSILAQYPLNVGSTEAVLRAEINPRFWGDTSYRLQYAPTACVKTGSWEANPCVRERPEGKEAPLGRGIDGAVRTAGIFLEGLSPDTEYSFRFAARSEGGGPVFGEGGEEGEEVGSDGRFHTLATPRPAGTDPCANALLRAGSGARLADCRAYELVSPVDKEGNDIRWGTLSDGTPVARIQSTPDGDKLTYTSTRRFADAVAQPAAGQYIASRVERGESGEGWSSHGISPPRGELPSGPLLPQNNEFQVFSEDLCTTWLINDDTTAPPLAPGGSEKGENFYRRSNCGVEGYEILYPDSSEAAAVQGIAEGGKRVLFRVKGQVFLKGPGGQAPVCVLPEEGEPTFGCSAGTRVGSDSGYEASVANALASDASRVYWTDSSSGSGSLYVRENPSEEQSPQKFGAAKGRLKLVKDSVEAVVLEVGSGEFKAGQTISGRGIAPGTTITAVGAGTLTLSTPATENRNNQALGAYSACTKTAMACTVAITDPIPATSPQSTTRQSAFLGAAADGAAALFSFDADRGEFGNGPANDDLYRFEAGSGTSTLVAHEVRGVLGAADDLSRVYLVSKEVLGQAGKENDAGEVAVEGEPNLYLNEPGGSPAFTFIARLAPSDADPGRIKIERSSGNPIPTAHTARVSPDGGTLAFESSASPTGYDNRDAESGETDLEVYRYEAATDRLACVSCNPSGARPTGRLVGGTAFAPDWAAAQIGAAQHQLFYPRSLSADGKRLFFESFEPLVRFDTNGEKDVYEWEAPGTGDCTSGSAAFSPPAQGCVSLISSGQNGEGSSFLDATPSGSDVFFTTEESLVPEDPDLIDIYDARVQGGFPPLVPPRSPCEGEACQAAPAPPRETPLASTAFNGPGNRRAPSRCRALARTAKRLSRRAKRSRRAIRKASSASRRRALQHRATRLSRRAAKRSRAARRCRARERANAKRRADR